MHEAEREIKRSENMLKYKDEINNRPRKEWFQSSKRTEIIKQEAKQNLPTMKKHFEDNIKPSKNRKREDKQEAKKEEKKQQSGSRFSHDREKDDKKKKYHNKKPEDAGAAGKKDKPSQYFKKKKSLGGKGKK